MPEVEGDPKDGHRQSQKCKHEKYKRRSLLVLCKDPGWQRNANAHCLHRPSLLTPHSAAEKPAHATPRGDCARMVRTQQETTMTCRSARPVETAPLLAHLRPVWVTVLDPVLTGSIIRQSQIRFGELLRKECGSFFLFLGV